MFFCVVPGSPNQNFCDGSLYRVGYTVVKWVVGAWYFTNWEVSALGRLTSLLVPRNKIRVAIEVRAYRGDICRLFSKKKQ